MWWKGRAFIVTHSWWFESITPGAGVGKPGDLATTASLRTTAHKSCMDEPSQVLSTLHVPTLLAIPGWYMGEPNFGYGHHVLCPWTEGLDLGLLSHGQVSSPKRSSANLLLSPQTCPWILPFSSLGLAVPFYSAGSSSIYTVSTAFYLIWYPKKLNMMEI